MKPSIQFHIGVQFAFWATATPGSLLVRARTFFDQKDDFGCSECSELASHLHHPPPTKPASWIHYNYHMVRTQLSISMLGQHSMAH